MLSGDSERHDVVVIGAGQAGLTVGQSLARRGVDVLILEGAARVGDQWRNRYDSLRLYSPAFADRLPDMPFPLPRFAFPTGRQMADYLEAYADRFSLPVRTGVRVDELTRADDAFVLRTGGQTIRAGQVVVATGAFQRPFVPPFAAELDPGIRQLHVADYRNPSQLADGPTLVVGLGHSGSDVAHELAATRHVILSGRGHGQLPVSIDRWAGPHLIFPLVYGVLSRVLTVDTPIGRKARERFRTGGPPLLRHRRPELTAAGVELTPARTTGVVDGKPQLDDGRVVDVANVVWCTGYRPDFGWIRLPVFDAGGWPRQYRGAVADEPGLYFVGLMFLHSLGSVFVFGAVRDGRYVADRIVERLASAPARDAGAADAAATT
jgi:putative flavoprotein involved in K+ transport